MGVCAGKTLAIRSEFAVKNSSMPLALDLDEKHKITATTETSTSTRVFSTKANFQTGAQMLAFFFIIFLFGDFKVCPLCP